jgi:hypothetical protein
MPLARSCGRGWGEVYQGCNLLKEGPTSGAKARRDGRLRRAAAPPSLARAEEGEKASEMKD